jgi:aminopeptidase N
LSKTIFEEIPNAYLHDLSLFISDFAYITKVTLNNIQIKIWSTQNKINLMNFALQNAKIILEYLQELIKYEYPFKKLDLVAIPSTSAKVVLINKLGIVTLKDSDIVQLENSHFSVIKTQRIVQNIASKISKIW